MTDQLPAVPETGALVAPTDTDVVPALTACVGDQVGCRYVEFSTANIRNPHTHRAYARACGRFSGGASAGGEQQPVEATY